MAMYADGSNVQIFDYNSRQVRLMAQNTEQLLETGPERAMLSGQDWKNLSTVAYTGMDDTDAFKSISTNEIVSYLMMDWMKRYASIFGVLARVEGQPVEQVETEVRAFQHQINEKVGYLRYLWGVHTDQILALQTALEQVRWNGPVVKEFRGVESLQGYPEHYLCTDALFPHVVDSDEGSCDLLFDTHHISITTLRVSIHEELALAIKKELAGYR